MFSQAESFNQPLNNWNVSKVEDMAVMFENARYFNQRLNKAAKPQPHARRRRVAIGRCRHLLLLYASYTCANDVLVLRVRGAGSVFIESLVGGTE